MSHTRVKRLLPVIIIALAVLLGQGLMALQGNPSKKTKVEVSPNVEVLTINRGRQQLYVNSQGTVSAKRTIAWASKVAGRVVWVAPEFMEGTEVAEGVLLLKLDPIDYRVAVANAEASLADANLALTEERSEFRRGTNYRASQQQSAAGSLRQPKLAQVEARVKAAQETLRQAQQDLAATEIKAPFAAIIDNKQVDLGQYVTPGNTLFNLLSTDKAEVRLPITPASIGFIHIAEEGESLLPKVELMASFGRIKRYWQGRLVRVESRVDSDTRTFFAVAEVDQPYNETIHGSALPVGLFVDATIEGVSIADGVRIPVAALHDNHFVYLVDDGLLQRREVQVLQREDQTVVISGGLDDGDQLVMTKLDLMVEGMHVTVVEGERADG